MSCISVHLFTPFRCIELRHMLAWAKSGSIVPLMRHSRLFKRGACMQLPNFTFNLITAFIMHYLHFLGGGVTSHALACSACSVINDALLGLPSGDISSMAGAPFDLQQLLGHCRACLCIMCIWVPGLSTNACSHIAQTYSLHQTADSVMLYLLSNQRSPFPSHILLHVWVRQNLHSICLFLQIGPTAPPFADFQQRFKPTDIWIKPAMPSTVAGRQQAQANVHVSLILRLQVRHAFLLMSVPRWVQGLFLISGI